MVPDDRGVSIVVPDDRGIIIVVAEVKLVIKWQSKRNLLGNTAKAGWPRCYQRGTTKTYGTACRCLVVGREGDDRADLQWVSSLEENHGMRASWKGDVQDACLDCLRAPASAQTSWSRLAHLLVHSRCGACEQHRSSSRPPQPHLPRNPRVDHSAQAQGIFSNHASNHIYSCARDIDYRRRKKPVCH